MSSKYSQLQRDYEGLKSEYQVCKRKLDSKCEALLIISKDLDQCRQERDQFKLMAEQVQERYQALKRQLAGVGPRPTGLDGGEYTGMKSQSLAHLLCEMREVNKTLQFELDDHKQKLNDAQGDIKLLREQIARQRMGSTDEGMNLRHFPAHEREDLVKKLEESREQYLQMQRDLQQVLDEKEEYVTERDVYKNKYERLNEELNYILKGDEKRILDIDGLVMENKYLQERLKQMEEEKTIAVATVSKYKTLLEKKKNKGILKLGQNRSSGVVITQKQVQQLLETKSNFNPTPQMMSDLQSLATALLETVNDKNLALSHQRKTNKILGTRVSELEKKLKTLEVAGFWNVPDKIESFEKLKLECEQIKTLIPSQISSPSEGSPEKELEDEDDSSEVSSEQSPQISPLHMADGCQKAGLSLEDLDLLPTKDVVISQDLAAGGDSGNKSLPNDKSQTMSKLSQIHPEAVSLKELNRDEETSIGDVGTYEGGHMLENVNNSALKTATSSSKEDYSSEKVSSSETLESDSLLSPPENKDLNFSITDEDFTESSTCKNNRSPTTKTTQNCDQNSPGSPKCTSPLLGMS